MRNLLVSTAALALSATAVSAADLPVAVKAPVAAAQFTWTGCFAGGQIGGAVNDDKSTNNLGNSITYQAAGLIAGGQIGCDYQFAPNWVIGVEGRAAWTSLNSMLNESVRFRPWACACRLSSVSPMIFSPRQRPVSAMSTARSG